MYKTRGLSSTFRLQRLLSTTTRISITSRQVSAVSTPAVPFAAAYKKNYSTVSKADVSSENYARIYNPVENNISLKGQDTFARRHLGPSPKEVNHMLTSLNYENLDGFIEAAIPEHILIKRALNVEPKKGYTESEMMDHLHKIAAKNEIVKSFIGKGYAGTIVPGVIIRNLLESPEWYTSYTPYQPEISQGRLESLLNYQTVVSDLTGLPIANASLLDEGSAAAEAMSMSFHNSRSKKSKYAVDSNIHPQTLDVIESRASTIGVEVISLPLSTEEGIKSLNEISSDLCGAIVQYPDTYGAINNFTKVGEIVHANKGLFAVATDLLALTLLKPPAEFGADIALGTSQRFGVPFGYGGPHAAFFATTPKFSRKIPGRIVGVSKDRLGKRALRLALQTREQHIKREKATSNICTAQALLANMSAMYAVYHGPEGLKNIAKRVFGLTSILAEKIENSSSHTIINKNWFDTLTVELNGVSASQFLEKALREYRINIFQIDDKRVSLTLDETATEQDLNSLIELFTNDGNGVNSIKDFPEFYPELTRTDEYLTNPVFNKHHSETAMLRYLHLLQSKDLSLANSMIPLGSCTMKLNSTVAMSTLSIPGFNSIHPFAPLNQAKGYQELLEEFSKDLIDITGFKAITLMPNSGAQGEYTGLSIIRQYHHSINESHRNICLIPVSAHGTNPASAAMAGLKVVPIKCLADGSIDITDLEAKASQHKDNLCSIMITYPSTYGLFGPGIKTCIDIVHKYGGQVYLDGANMNAQVGLTSPGDLGADICHLNIHKTFSLSHGGGGPGSAPVAMAEHLASVVPSHLFLKTPGSSKDSIKAVCSAPFGSASVAPVSYAYIKMLGAEGLPYASAIAVLNANYMLHRLKEHYKIMFINEKGFKHCAHEFILDLRDFKTFGIEAIDVAKRLQDYGFHAPTMSFPVAGTLMIEPTESENLEELDRFVDSLIAIKGEIDAYEKKEGLGNCLKNAPHSLEDIISTSQAEWDARGYTREQAAYPLPYLKVSKCWPTVSRLDDTYGDMNLLCTCPSVEEVAEDQA